MDKIRIRGGRPLAGEIVIGGAKNAGLPLMAAGLLTDDRLMLTNVPGLADIRMMAALIGQLGVAVERPADDGHTLSIGGAIASTEAPYDIMRKMRASVLVLVAVHRQSAGCGSHPPRADDKSPGGQWRQHSPGSRRRPSRFRSSGSTCRTRRGCR